MKKLLLSLTLIMGITTFAQDINCSVEKNQYTSSKETFYINQIIETGNGGKLLVYTVKGPFYYFQALDASDKIIKEGKFEAEDKVTEQIFTYKSKLYLIFRKYNKSAKAHDFYIASANLSDFKFTSKKLISVSIEKEDWLYSSWSASTADPHVTYYNVLVDKDKSAFAIYADSEGEDEKYTGKLYVYNTESQELIMEKTYPREEKADMTYQYRGLYTPDNGNTVYLIGEARKRAFFKDKSVPDFEIQKITKEDMVQQKLGTETSCIRELSIVAKKDRIALAGFYGVNKEAWIKGVCYFDVNPSGLEILQSKFHPLTSQFSMDKFGKIKKEIEIGRYDVFHGALTGEDGSIFISAEDYERDIRSTPNGTSYGTPEYLDIISARIADNGDLLWMRNINKDQTPKETKYSSYRAFVKNNELYLFFNVQKYEDMGKGRTKFRVTNTDYTDLIALKLDAKGEMAYKTLISKEDESAYLQPRSASFGNDFNNVYIFGQDDEKKMIVKIKL